MFKNPSFGSKTAIMVDTVITHLLATTLYITSSAFATPAAAQQVAFNQVLPQQNAISYTVKSNNTLAHLSTQFYGSEDFWTNIWNDNTWIMDPNKLENGQMVTIQVTKPDHVEDLSIELASRSAELAQKDDAQATPTPTEAPVMPTAPVAAMMPTLAPTAVPAAPVANVASQYSEEAITALGACEAGNNPARNSGNGYYGAFQFSYGTWKSLNTGYERADMAPIEVQRAAVKQLLQRSSIYGQFPGCARQMKNAGLI